MSGSTVASVIAGGSHASLWQLQIALQLTAVGYHMSTPAIRVMIAFPFLMPIERAAKLMTAQSG
jgi:hypothetical protein